MEPSMNYKGELVIKFTQEMDASYSPLQLVKKHLKFKLQTSTDEQDNSSERSLAVKSWNVTRSESKSMAIKLEFDNPTLVSVGDKPDKIVLEVVNASQIFKPLAQSNAGCFGTRKLQE